MAPGRRPRGPRPTSDRCATDLALRYYMLTAGLETVPLVAIVARVIRYVAFQSRTHSHCSAACFSHDIGVVSAVACARCAVGVARRREDASAVVV